MDINEFEIRYRSFVGLNNKKTYGRTNDQILLLCNISDRGTLSKKLNETDPNELKSLTIETYSDYKISFLNELDNSQQTTIKEYIIRLEYELKVIKEMGFNSYLLVVADFINRSKNNHIPVGPGRGSAAGSLIAWLIGITDVDPIEFGLLFERFLNPARVSMPDIDTDFDDEQRDKVFEYVKEHYGSDLVAKIGTFMNMSAKAAFKDVARVMGVPFEASNRISRLFTIINDDRTINFQKCRQDIEELRTMLESDDTIKKVVDITENLIGTYRQTGVHACGIVIGPDNLTNYLPLQLAPHTTYSPNEWNVTQYDYNAAKIEDTIGVIKMDFLGLGNLSIIKNAIKIIKKRHEATQTPLPTIFQNYEKTSSFELPLDDQHVYQTIFQKGNTTGIFQFESEGMKRFLMLLKPDKFDDIVSMSALYRPGPIEFIPSFIRRKNKEEPIEYMYPELYSAISQQYDKQTADEEKRKLIEDLEPILESTYGVAVFQEQLMFMSQSIAGFSFAQADELRRGIGKKLVTVVQKLKQEFITKAQEFRQYQKETATWVFEKMIEPAALYSFNKSHSVAYSLIAYQTAYLKTYYPIEFYASLLRANESNTDELSKFINEVKFQGFKITIPHINESFNHVSAIDDYIRLGFVCIKGVGSEVGETIQKQRQLNGSYKSLGDFLTRCQSVINKKSLEGLIKSGALDCFNDRGTLLHHMDHLLERSKSSHHISDGGLFGGGFSQQSLELEPGSQLSIIDRLKLEHDVFKTFVSAHPLDGLYPRVKARGLTMISQFKNRNRDKEQKDYGVFNILTLVTKITRAKKKGYFIKVEDYSDSVEFFVKEPLDLADFDLLLISGYKGKGTPRWRKIIKVNHEKIIHIAQDAGKYNLDETVYEVKKRRLGQTSMNNGEMVIGGSTGQGEGNDELGLEIVTLSEEQSTLLENQLLEHITPDSPLEERFDDIPSDNQDNSSPSNSSNDLEYPTNDQQRSQDNQKDSDITHTSTSIQYKCELPDSIQKIKEMQEIIRKHPGDLAVSLGNMIVYVTPGGWELLSGLGK
ncbi:MAG TPA: DNA polymerase III subunit alpha [Candidatus Absconditabacterales bacterium]|nr:DNA polymerase III subunit alpha [Candidatus Absconditabacterales bacterium]